MCPLQPGFRRRVLQTRESFERGNHAVTLSAHFCRQQVDLLRRVTRMGGVVQTCENLKTPLTVLEKTLSKSLLDVGVEAAMLESVPLTSFLDVT